MPPTHRLRVPVGGSHWLPPSRRSARSAEACVYQRLRGESYRSHRTVRAVCKVWCVVGTKYPGRALVMALVSGARRPI